MDAIRVAAFRGDVAESTHRVHAVLVRGGAVADAAGDPSLVTFMRSASKPFQALPLVRAVPDLPSDELAIACSSHESGAKQLAAVRALLARARAAETDLACGAAEPSRLAHNCSGKHAGMMLLCRVRRWPIGGYERPDHPLQRELRALIGEVTDAMHRPVPIATDGCGVPTFAVSLISMASAFEQLVAKRFAGAEPIVAAMLAHPDLVGGPQIIDTTFMRAVRGALAKRGAEGLLCGALPDGAGFALKVEDGASRALGPAAAAFFGISALAEEPILNSRAELVGRVACE